MKNKLVRRSSDSTPAGFKLKDLVAGLIIRPKLVGVGLTWLLTLVFGMLAGLVSALNPEWQNAIAGGLDALANFVRSDGAIEPEAIAIVGGCISLPLTAFILSLVSGKQANDAAELQTILAPANQGVSLRGGVLGKLTEIGGLLIDGRIGEKTKARAAEVVAKAETPLIVSDGSPFELVKPADLPPARTERIFTPPPLKNPSGPIDPPRRQGPRVGGKPWGFAEAQTIAALGCVIALLAALLTGCGSVSLDKGEGNAVAGAVAGAAVEGTTKGGAFGSLAASVGRFVLKNASIKVEAGDSGGGLTARLFGSGFSLGVWAVDAEKPGPFDPGFRPTVETLSTAAGDPEPFSPVLPDAEP